MFKWVLTVGIILGTLALIPPAIIAKQRTTKTEKRRIHLIQDMDNQPRFNAQDPSANFADGRAMRAPIEGTVARGELGDDDHLESGFVMQGGSPTWVTTFPAQYVVDRAFVERGRDRYNIYCLPCHGAAGYGDGIIHQRANVLAVGGTNGTTWVAPKNIHEQLIREQPIGRIYNTVTNGVRNMAGYKAQVERDDRWAIVAYVKALQRSQNARPTDVEGGTGSLKTQDETLSQGGDS